MTITLAVFEAFLRCPTKAFLRFCGQTNSRNAYSQWIKAKNESYSEESIRRLTEQFGLDAKIINSLRAEDLGAAEWLFLDNIAARTEDLESPVHAVQRLSSNKRGKQFEFVPVRTFSNHKVTRREKLLLGFDALVLSEMLGQKICSGKIIHGIDHVMSVVNVIELIGEVRKRVKEVTNLLSDGKPPDLVLNRHCTECEFQFSCRQRAMEQNDLSLLPSVSAKERKKMNQKGIFTVTQLSYTFRPRRRSKKLSAKPERYHHALKALAIREQKLHIVGNPELKVQGTPVFLDVEGLPDRDFYYLIGIRVGFDEPIVQYSLWADDAQGEKTIWTDFLNTLVGIQDPHLLHYGSYEKTFLERMRAKHGIPPSLPQALVKSLDNSLNILSFIFAQFYFPTYSNGLKDIAGFLGFNWSDPCACGTQSVIWRESWEDSSEAELKEKLVTYNLEDCQALELVTRTLLASATPASEPTTDQRSSNIVQVDSLKRQTMWSKFSSPLGDFEHINKAARWDYQRNRVYVRSSKRIKRAVERKSTPKMQIQRVKKFFAYAESPYCPICKRSGHRHLKPTKRVLFDIHIGKFNLRRNIVEYSYHVFWCSCCRKQFGVPFEFWPKSKYGRNLVSYFIYHTIGLQITMNAACRSLNRLLGITLTQPICHNFKASAAAYYEETQQKILARLLQSSMLNVDETRASNKGKTAYVWVITNLHEVAYLYADTREGEFIQTTLREFKGVIVSDFYAAYDSLNCPQQKCLLHLIRDLNTEILSQPFNLELREISEKFGKLLKAIIETVDRYGLKKYHLHKHQAYVERFYRELGKSDYQSESASKCKQRFEKNRNKLFTFLEYDGVPWNNNNAEHAIKAFAGLRQFVRGSWTGEAIKEYLVLLSVCQTCKYSGIDFFRFSPVWEKRYRRRLIFESRRIRRLLLKPQREAF